MLEIRYSIAFGLADLKRSRHSCCISPVLGKVVTCKPDEWWQPLGRCHAELHITHRNVICVSALQNFCVKASLHFMHPWSLLVASFSQHVLCWLVGVFYHQSVTKMANQWMHQGGCTVTFEREVWLIQSLATEVFKKCMPSIPLTWTPSMSFASNPSKHFHSLSILSCTYLLSTGSVESRPAYLIGGLRNSAGKLMPLFPKNSQEIKPYW